jgi:oxygen-independent coproporphyrinogen-3 oxidase
MQRTPAGFPSGMPGMGEEMEGAMQHAPQFFLQRMKNGGGWSTPKDTIYV